MTLFFFHISSKAKDDKEKHIFTCTSSVPYWRMSLVQSHQQLISSDSNPWLLGAQALDDFSAIFFPQVHTICRFKHKICCSVYKYGTWPCVGSSSSDNVWFFTVDSRCSANFRFMRAQVEVALLALLVVQERDWPISASVQWNILMKNIEAVLLKVGFKIKSVGFC